MHVAGEHADPRRAVDADPVVARQRAHHLAIRILGHCFGPDLGTGAGPVSLSTVTRPIIRALRFEMKNAASAIAPSAASASANTSRADANSPSAWIGLAITSAASGRSSSEPRSPMSLVWTNQVVPP